MSAIGFAFCPFVFAHTAHIQLLMTAGLPFTLLAFHRLPGRGGGELRERAKCVVHLGRDPHGRILT